MDLVSLGLAAAVLTGGPAVAGDSVEDSDRVYAVFEVSASLVGQQDLDTLCADGQTCLYEWSVMENGEDLLTVGVLIPDTECFVGTYFSPSDNEWTPLEIQCP